MATIIGDAIIRIVVDPSAAVAAVDGQKGNEQARPAEKSKKPRKRSDGEGSETNTTDTPPPEEVTNRATKEDEKAFREHQDLERRDARAQKKRSAFIEKERKKREKSQLRDMVSAKAGRQAIAGRATRRILNRTVPIIGRAATVGKQAAQTFAPLAGIKAAGGVGAAVGTATGTITAGAMYGHQATQFISGAAGGGAGKAASFLGEAYVLFTLFPQLGILGALGAVAAGVEPVGEVRGLMDIRRAMSAGYTAGQQSLSSALGAAAVAGTELTSGDIEREQALAKNAARNAYERSLRETTLERNLSGMAAGVGGQAFGRVIARPFQNARTQR